MRRPRLQWTIRRIMIAVAVLGTGAWAFAEYQRNGLYYAAGWWAAECELWRGEATIYTLFTRIGLADTCNIDRGTGLPVRGLSCCRHVIGDSERVKGHNDHIAQYIRWNGLPRNTFKPWVRELLDLYHYFDGRSLRDVPLRLLVDGPAIVSPDGRHSVRLVQRAKDTVCTFDSRRVVIYAGNVVLHEHFAHFEKGDSDLLWGPKGSRFAVIRSVCEKKEHYVAYDLRTGSRLREESWHEWKRRDEWSKANPHEYRSPIATED
jgi:hypothetical protein